MAVKYFIILLKFWGDYNLHYQKKKKKITVCLLHPTVTSARCSWSRELKPRKRNHEEKKSLYSETAATCEQS